MNEQLCFIFDSSDWQRVIPYTHQRTYLKIEGWLTTPELNAFQSAVEENSEMLETAREAVLNKRMRLIEFFQQEGFAT